MSALPLPPPAHLAWWRQLHLRLALGTLAVVVAVGISLAWWLDTHLRRQQDAQWQWQGLGLAQYIISQQAEPLLAANGRVRNDLLNNLAMYVRMINPGLEVYVLSNSGEVLGHTIEPSMIPAGTRVDLAPLQALAKTPLPQLPIYGDDPCRPGQQNLISTARLELDGQQMGHLYVILRGEHALAAGRGAQSEPLRAAAWRFLPGILLVSLVLMVVVQWRLTRPLVRLTTLLNRLRPDESDHVSLMPVRARDEVELATQAAEALQARLRRQLDQLEDNERQRRELLASISHDLHTPLAAMQGYAETLMLKDESLSPALRQQYLHTLMQNCHRLERRVKDLFELSKLESAQTAVQWEEFDLAELAHDVVQSLQVLAQQRQVSLNLSDLPDAAAHGAMQVEADIGMIERVLQNLIDNAIGHTPPGGEVSVRLALTPHTVLLEVMDTGEGIAEEDLPHIFKPYWHGQRTQTAGQMPSPRARSGLGLSIVLRILALHGRQPQVSSVRGRGTAIRFELSRSAPATEPD